MSTSASPLRPYPDCPLVVAYGLGVDSTAMLIEFANRGIKPDLILFANTGGEKPETIAYLDVIGPYLQKVAFPDVTVVRYQPKTAVYHTLEGQCLHTGTLPSLAYGGKSCSLKYKRSCQDRLILQTYPPAEMIQRGKRVVRAIGFDATEQRRTYAHCVKAIGLDAGEQHRKTWQQAKPTQGKRISRDQWLDQNYFSYWYPLMEWGFNRERCKQIITAAGLPVPIKSACWFCPASKKREIAWLQEHHPELMERALAIERNAQAKLKTVKGLGRSFSWESFLAKQNSLSLLDGCDCPAS